jgi:hypothetical protein
MTLIVLSVLVIVLLVAVLAIYLFWVGTLLTKIADNLDNCNGSVKTILGHAKLIVPAVEHINRTGGVVAGALPLLYGGAERIATKEVPAPAVPTNGHTAPASGRRRSRLTDTVGFRPPSHN